MCCCNCATPLFFKNRHMPLVYITIIIVIHTNTYLMYLACILVIESVLTLIINQCVYNTNAIHTKTGWYVLNAYLLGLNTSWFVFNTYYQYIPQGMALHANTILGCIELQYMPTLPRLMCSNHWWDKVWHSVAWCQICVLKLSQIVLN